MLWVASENVEVQRNGCVVVVWPTLSILQRLPPMDEHVVGKSVVDTAPMRMTSIHFCMSFPEYNAMFRLMRAIVVSAFSKYHVRITFHTDSATVCKYEMMTYGVPVEVFPMTETGNIKTKNQHQWIKARRAIESYEQKYGRAITDSDFRNVSPNFQQNINAINNSALQTLLVLQQMNANNSKNNVGVSDRPIECPCRDDVCFRYGMSYQWHKGNARFRELLESYMSDHDKAVSNDEKVAVTYKILEELDRWNCRFLSWDRQGWWSEITDQNARRIKIAVAMKEHKKRLQARRNCQQSNSSTNKFESDYGKKRKRTMNEDGRGSFSSCFL
jgi:hypothetical protein